MKYSYNEKHKKQYADGIESVNIKDGLNVHARELAPVYSFTHIRTLRTVDTPDCGLLVLVPLSHPTLPSLKSAESFQAREDPAASQHPRAWKRLELQVTSSKRIQVLRCTSMHFEAGETTTAFFIGGHPGAEYWGTYQVHQGQHLYCTVP